MMVVEEGDRVESRKEERGYRSESFIEVVRNTRVACPSFVKMAPYCTTVFDQGRCTQRGKRTELTCCPSMMTLISCSSPLTSTP